MKLTIDGIGMQFGGLWANYDVSFGVQEGSISALIGPNGAGKTTLFNVISGFQTPTLGKVSLDGQVISGLPAEKVAARGVGRTFQLPEICHDLTLLENVMVGAYRHIRGGLFGQMLGLGAAAHTERSARERAEAELERAGLAEQRNRPARALPLGQVRLLEIARALASQPSLLLLDESASGLNAREVENLAQLIKQLPGRGITVLLIEHNVRFVMQLAGQIAVLDHGRLLSVGTPAEIRNDQRVITAYLGRRHKRC